jgi:hypothetical protein
MSFALDPTVSVTNLSLAIDFDISIASRPNKVNLVSYNEFKEQNILRIQRKRPPLNLLSLISPEQGEQLDLCSEHP